MTIIIAAFFLTLLPAKVQANISSEAFSDFDGDGVVGMADFLLFAKAFGKSAPKASCEEQFDLNHDGKVNFADWLIFAAAFGKRVSVVPIGTWAVADNVPENYRIRLQLETVRVHDWYLSNYAVEADSFTVLVGMSLDTFKPLYEDVLGQNLIYVSGSWATRTSTGRPVMVFMFGNYQDAKADGDTFTNETEASFYSRQLASIEHSIIHEYFHILQYQMSKVNRPAWWLIESTANYADLVYTEANPNKRRPFWGDFYCERSSRYTPYEDLNWFIENQGWREEHQVDDEPPSVVIKRLEKHYTETKYPHLYAYALSFTALLCLMEQPQVQASSYIDFWKLLKEKETWQEAFEEAFGIVPQELYDIFDEWLLEKLSDPDLRSNW